MPTILLLANINFGLWLLIFHLNFMDQHINAPLAPPYRWIRRVAIDVGADTLHDAAICAAEGYVT